MLYRHWAIGLAIVGPSLLARRAAVYRETGPHATSIYEAAESWVHHHLVSDGSLFSKDPARSVATQANVAALYDAFVNHPDMGHDTFAVKLRGQLSGQPPDVVQLAAEALFALYSQRPRGLSAPPPSVR